MSEAVLELLRLIYGASLTEGQAAAIWNELLLLAWDLAPEMMAPIAMPEPVPVMPPRPGEKPRPGVEESPPLGAMPPMQVLGPLIDALLEDDPTLLGKDIKIFEPLNKVAEEVGVNLKKAAEGRQEFRTARDVLNILEEAGLLTAEELSGAVPLDTPYEQEVIEPLVKKAIAAYKTNVTLRPSLSLADFLRDYLPTQSVQTKEEFAEKQGRYERFMANAQTRGVDAGTLEELNKTYDALKAQAKRFEDAGMAFDFDAAANQVLSEQALERRISTERDTRWERFAGHATRAGITDPVAIDRVFQRVKQEAENLEAIGQTIDFDQMALEALAETVRAAPVPKEAAARGIITPQEQAALFGGEAARREQERKLRGGLTKEEMDQLPAESAELEERRRAEEAATAGALQTAAAGGLPGGGFPSAAVQAQATSQQAREEAARRGARQAEGPDFFAFLEREFGAAQREQESKREEVIKFQQNLPVNVKSFMGLFPSGTPGGEMLNFAVGKPLTFSDWLGTNMPQLRSKFEQGTQVAVQQQKTLAALTAEQRRQETEALRLEEERRLTPKRPRATIFRR